MTADDARELVKGSQPDHALAIRAVLNCWHAAIRKAARAGRVSITEGEIDRPRMPISAAARIATREQLRAAGFVVENYTSGPNETEVRVSWDASPHGG